MSGKRGPWIDRRGQANLAVAIDQVIDLRSRPGEQIQHIPDEQIEDSPYQARQSFSNEQVEDLAQGMRIAGFQGVLIVRPHGDVERRRRGFFQLVYGHRRRAAWRRVCTERGEACALPVIVREIDDAQIWLRDRQMEWMMSILVPAFLGLPSSSCSRKLSPH